VTSTVSAKWAPGSGRRLTHEFPSYIDVTMHLRGLVPGLALVAVTLTAIGTITDEQRGGVPALSVGFDHDDGLWLPTAPRMQAAPDVIVNGGGLVGTITLDPVEVDQEFARLRVLRDPTAEADTLNASLAVLRITVGYPDE
jgi:hypothetical protein